MKNNVAFVFPYHLLIGKFTIHKKVDCSSYKICQIIQAFLLKLVLYILVILPKPFILVTNLILKFKNVLKQFFTLVILYLYHDKSITYHCWWCFN